MNDIHKRIKQLRTAKDLSMEALAEVVGVTWQTIQQWEKTTAPKRTRLAKVAQALGTTQEYLMTGATPAGKEVLAIHQSVAAYTHANKTITQIIALLEATDDAGRTMALGAVKAALRDHQPTKANRA